MISDQVRSVLVAAWLRGEKQIRMAMHGDGDCALGKLHNAICEEKYRCSFGGGLVGSPRAHLADTYGLTKEDMTAIANANDKGWDLLTIARKVGVEEEG